MAYFSTAHYITVRLLIVVNVYTCKSYSMYLFLTNGAAMLCNWRKEISDLFHNEVFHISVDSICIWTVIRHTTWIIILLLHHYARRQGCQHAANKYSVHVMRRHAPERNEGYCLWVSLTIAFIVWNWNVLINEFRLVTLYTTSLQTDVMWL